MSHVPEDRLLLFAYGEVPAADAAETSDVVTHLAACPTCRAELERLELARAAAEWALGPAPRRRLRWLVGLGALAAAAALAFVLGHRPPEPRSLSIMVPRYAAPELAPIDSLLTRLEQEKLYAIP
jgi:hypothetical protein